MSGQRRSADGPDPRLQELLAACIEAIENGEADPVPRVCADRPDLAPVVRSHVDRLRALDMLASPRQPIPQSIGPYRILEVLGGGGMGRVYKAERREPVRQLVALKVVRPGLATDDVLARFEIERRALAAMNHRYVAKVFDAGATDRGEPYFVMELVEGLPITEYCDALRLSLRERLELFREVCHGVQHAHQKGVIHRDLKPSNVLVAHEGDEAVPKILDFGLAKATDRDEGDGARFTEKGGVLGTPEYMSPEQAAGDGRMIDSRADVYSLGVMLYELLTGELPFPTQQLRRVTPIEALRIVREVDPPKPSTRLASSPDSAAARATRCSTSIAALSRALKGDLDWVVMRALSKEPERRYDSATALAMELSRYLKHEPVLAGPPSAAYRASKLLRRYRVQATAAAAVLVTALAGTAVSLNYAWKADASATDALTNLGRAREQTALAERSAKLAEESRVEADRRAEQTRLVATFETQLFEDLSIEEFGKALVDEFRREVAGSLMRVGGTQAEADEARVAFDGALRSANPTNVARAALQKTVFEPAARKIEEKYAAEPLIQALLSGPLAGTLYQLGMYELGEEVSRATESRRRAGLGDDDTDTLVAIGDHGVLLTKLGRTEEAEKLLREAAAGLRANLGPDDWHTLTVTSNLVSLLHDRGEIAEAEQVCRDVLEHALHARGDDDREAANALSKLARLLQDQGRLAEAEPIARRAMEIRRRTLGEDHTDTLYSIYNVAWLLTDLDRLAEADPLCHEALDGRRRRLGDTHPDTLMSMSQLAGILDKEGHWPEAEELHRKVLAARRLALGPEDRSTLESLAGLSLVLWHERKANEAEHPCREALEGRRRTLGPEHKDTLTSMSDLALILMDTGRAREAEELNKEVLAVRRQELGPDHQDTLTSMNNLAGSLWSQRKYPEAEEVIREVVVLSGRKLGPQHSQTLAAVNTLSMVLLSQRKAAEAESILMDAVTTCRREHRPPDETTNVLLLNLASALDQQRKPAEAESVLRDALDGCTRLLGPDDPRTLMTSQRLGDNLVQQRRFADAEPYLREALRGRRASFGVDRAETIQSMRSLALVSTRLEKPDEAEQLYRDALVSLRKTLDESDPTTCSVIAELAVLLTNRGKLEEAERLFREVLGHRENAAEGDQLALSGTAGLGTVLAARGHFAEAEALLLRAASSERCPPRERRAAIAALIDGYDERQAATPDGRSGAEATRWRDTLRTLEPGH